MESKLSNPKDKIATNKIPMHLWPATATAMGSLALLYGARLYGRSNWREAGVRASVYVSACQRHLAAWFENEDNDPESNLPHLGHALACLAILVDAQAVAVAGQRCRGIFPLAMASFGFRGLLSFVSMRRIIPQ